MINRNNFYYLILFCLINTTIALSQKKREYSLQDFYKLGEELCSTTSNKSLCKAFKFYRQKQYDSCYVYSNEALLKTSLLAEKNILNYIQGVSAIKKKLYKKAQNNILAISDDVEYISLKELKLGVIYLFLKEYNKAIPHYLKWEQKNRSGDEELKRHAYHNLGMCYMHKKIYDRAKYYFNKELAILNKKDTATIIRAKIELGNVYYNQYLDVDAIPLFKEAYELAQCFSDLELKHFTAKNMAVVEKNRKRYKESISYYLEYDKLKDSIWNRDKIWELTERDKKIAIAQKQQEISLHQEKIKRQKIIQKGLLVGAVSLLLFIIGLTYLYRKLKSKNKLITKQKEALSVANRTKDYLFSVVSHDLRSPINAIKNQHEHLKAYIDNNNLSAIKTAAQKAILITESTSQLVNNILHWSLEQRNQMLFAQNEYALHPLLNQVLYDYQDIVEAKNITLNTNFEDDLVVWVDKESLKIVLRNLIDNAIKYLEGVGEINVSAKQILEKEVLITISDTGVGMSLEKLERINTLEDLSIDKIDRAKGVGLGVLLCQTLIKKNKGQLVFYSELGKGTTASITLLGCG